VYQLAENYPFKAPVREMRSLYRAGEIGELQYAECEYLHAFAPASLARFAPHPGHWRARISSTAYCSHSIAPVLYVAGARPVEVAAFVVPLDASPASRKQARRGRGTAALLVVRLEGGALLKSLHGFLQGESEPETLWLRVHGSRGLLETLRHGDSRRVRLRREAWAAPSGAVEDEVREASWNEALERRAGLRSDDLLLCRSFAAAVRTGEPPCFDVHLGVATSLAGICGLRSIAERGASVEIPDLRREEVRRRYESDESVGLEPLAADPLPA
jgi:predicted dehydrogenase